MKIFYSGLMYDNYDHKRGFSFEHNNFYLSLKNLSGVQLFYFPFDRILEVGKEKFNSELLNAATKEKPDLIFFFMLSDELDKKTLEALRKITKTVAWFADDSWRFWNYSRFWAKYFSWVITTYSWMPELYRKIGQSNVLRSEWAANINFYKPVIKESGKNEDLSVAFVGGWTRPRAKIIRSLEKAGVSVKAYGSGWPLGRVSDDKMIEIFSNSKINLGLNPPPGFLNKNSLGRLFFRRSINKIIPDFHLVSNLRSLFCRGIPQIKARHFEIPACGGFLLTSKADDIENFYEVGKEIVLYDGINDLVKKIKYYLSHEDERSLIAEAGYKKTLKNYTYQKVLGDILNKIIR